MGAGQIAVIWMLHEQQELAAEAASKRMHRVDRPSFAKRISAKVRKFAFRNQLGPTTHFAAA